MTDEVNKNPLPRVVKGTGYYTPMDIAPGESPASAAPTSSPPASASPTPAGAEPAQTSEGSTNAEGN